MLLFFYFSYTATLRDASWLPEPPLSSPLPIIPVLVSFLAPTYSTFGVASLRHLHYSRSSRRLYQSMYIHTYPSGRAAGQNK